MPIFDMTLRMPLPAALTKVAFFAQFQCSFAQLIDRIKRQIRVDRFRAIAGQSAE